MHHKVSSCWPYAHDRFEDEIFTENAQDWEEVMARMADPKETRFKAMSWDEQETVLEQTVQETIKTREEMISVRVVGSPQGTTEITGIAQVALVQARNFSEVQDIQGMGGLMYQHAQLLMKSDAG
jgi:hypothetical protein